MSQEPQNSLRRRGIFQALVAHNHRLCDQHYLLRLAVPEDFPSTQPGQFVQLLCRDPQASSESVVHDRAEGDWPKFVQPEVLARRPMLRRPFSLAGRVRHEGRMELEIIHRVVGVGSAWLSELKVGEPVSVLGPLGNTFSWPQRIEQAVLVGGGVGIPPMIYLASALAEAGKQAVAFIGATAKNLLPLSIDASVPPSQAGWQSLCVREFARYGVEASVSTDDGSLGFPGRVTEALWLWLDQGRAQAGKTVVYTCGPELMMRAVAQGCISRGVACQVAMERKMACGMGTCQSCVCKTRSQDEAGWQYKLVCTDGPVFDAHQLIWER